jgi:hypothetical protein
MIRTADGDLDVAVRGAFAQPVPARKDLEAVLWILNTGAQ